jgi:nucleoid DNA-binding protein
MVTMLKHHMSKAELADHLSSKCDLARDKVTELLAELAAVAAREVHTNDVFALPGIGRVIKQTRPERHAVNPADGSPIRLAPKTLIKFEFAAEFGKTVLAK